MGKLVSVFYVACQPHMTIIGPFVSLEDASRASVVQTQISMTGIGDLPPTGCVFLPYQGFLVVGGMIEPPAEDVGPQESSEEIQKRGLEKLKKLMGEKDGD